MSEIPGLEVIYAPTYGIDKRVTEDATRLPFKLYANFRHTEFMLVAAIAMFGGSEEYVLRAETREALEEAIRVNEWRGHPRLRRLVLTLPDGTEELIEGRR